jgi:hypothetical protein
MTFLMTCSFIDIRSAPTNAFPLTGYCFFKRIGVCADYISAQNFLGAHEVKSKMAVDPAVARRRHPQMLKSVGVEGFSLVRAIYGADIGSRYVGKAANIAEQNSKHAIDMAQKLSHQLRAAQQRISELEAEVGAYQKQAERAEQWLLKVYTEIEDRFLQQDRSRARNGTQ